MKPCPICNQFDMLSVTTKQSFSELFIENGGATITVRCYRCGLELWEHSYHGKNYKTKLQILTEKWDNMPRREQEDDGK